MPPQGSTLTVVHGANLRRCKPEVGTHATKKVYSFHADARAEFDQLVAGHLGLPATQLLVFALKPAAKPVFLEESGDIADEDNPQWTLQVCADVEQPC